MRTAVGGAGRIGARGAPRPFIKWAGGKTQLLDQFERLYPQEAGRVRGMARYVEPFVGSGAVFFAVRELLRPAKAILADSNAELINLYSVLRDDAEKLIRLLARHKRRHSTEHYYRVRSQDTDRLSDASRAARMLYLNKTCFNGLYRVNSRGQFNVPMGRYADPQILDAENLRGASRALRGTVLKVADFREAPSYCREGDFVYLDPPYHPLSDTARFTSYTKGAFREADQRDLVEVCRELDRKGCLIMLSNSDSDLIRKLYDGPPFVIERVSARRSINSKADARGRIDEVVVRNYISPQRVNGGRAAS